MSTLWNIGIVVITMPLNVAFWALLASLPLRLALHGRSLVIVSIAVALGVLFSIAAFKDGLPIEVRVVGMVAAVISAPISYLWWLGRSQRKFETVHG